MILPIFQGFDAQSFSLLQTRWASLLNPVINGSGTGVTSLNSLKDAVTLAAGTNISLSTSGNTITITGSGATGVTSLNTQSGALTLLPGSNISITPGAGTLSIAATSGGSGDINQGGNAFGATLTLGSTDNQDFDFISDNLLGMVLKKSGQMIFGRSGDDQNHSMNGATFTILNTPNTQSAGLLAQSGVAAPSINAGSYGAFLNLLTANQNSSPNIAFVSGTAYTWACGVDPTTNGSFELCYLGGSIGGSSQVPLDTMLPFMTANRAGKFTFGNASWNVVTHEFQGSVALTQIGNGFLVKEGSNARMGKSTLVGGTVVVSNTTVTANTRIFLTTQNSSGSPGFLIVSTRSVGTSFTILSSSNTDTSDVAWILIEPA